MIKIVSGFSIPSGPTVALVNLCNQFNERGYGCIFYGPDKWHLDKCRAADISAFRPEEEDTVIIHHIKLFSPAELDRMPSKVAALGKTTSLSALRDMLLKLMPAPRKRAGVKLILTCQAKEHFPLKRLNNAIFNKIHYADFSQTRYHKIKRDYFISPNFVSPLTPGKIKPEKVGGIIGSIRKENRIELSVEEAFRDGMEKVFIYGYMFDPLYYYRMIEPLTKKYPGRIRYAGFVDDKQRMYDSLSDVYCGVSKPWRLVIRECCLTNTHYHGPDPCTRQSMSDEQIFAVWKDQLGL